MNRFGTLFLILLSVSSYLVAQESNALKMQVKNSEPTELPYISTEWSPFKVGNLPQSDRQDLPIYVYNDLRGINKEKEEICLIFRYFNSTNGNYKMFLISLGEYDNFRKLLVTYDSSYKLLSCMEVSYLFDSFRNFKQWKLNKDMTLEVYNIKVLSPDRVDPSSKNDFKELKGQRIDTYYQIDSLGHFKKEKEILYEPEMYPRSYFRGDEERPIWNGKEVVEKERVY